MQLNAQQMQTMAESNFENRLVETIARDRPEAKAALTSVDGKQVLREQVALARGYGLASELDVARFVITAWLLGPGFDTKFPAMNQVLTAPQLPPEQKSDFIERICSAVLIELQAGART
jgi:hypothetical protein